MENGKRIAIRKLREWKSITNEDQIFANFKMFSHHPDCRYT